MAAGSIPVPNAQICSGVSQVPKYTLKCPRCCSCGSPLLRKDPCPWATHGVKELISQRPMYCGDLEQRLLCKPKSPQVSGELCLDSRACLRLSAAHCTGLAPTPSQRSYSPRITANEKRALCLLNESLKRINLLGCGVFLSKHRMQYL